MFDKNFRQKLLLYVCLAVLCSAVWVKMTFAVDWQESKSDHFIVYYTQDAKFAKDVLDKAEIDYKNIATDLGYPRYSEFWTWDKRVKIYIYPDHKSFIKATDQPEWSHGMAEYNTKRIVSFSWSQDFLESLLPHEMAHLIFRDFVGFKGEVPLWLDEGVAQWAEEDKRADMKRSIRQLYDDDTLLSLKDMMKHSPMEVRGQPRTFILTTMTKKGEKAPLILGSDNFVNIYYLQSFSLVGFLIDKYGSGSFADFCRQLRDGKSLEEAMQFAYPARLRNLNDLETEWRRYIAEH